MKISIDVEERPSLGHNPYLCNVHITPLLAPLDTHFRGGCFRHRRICWTVSVLKRRGHIFFFLLDPLFFYPKTRSYLRVDFTHINAASWGIYFVVEGSGRHGKIIKEGESRLATSGRKGGIGFDTREECVGVDGLVLRCTICK